MEFRILNSESDVSLQPPASRHVDALGLTAELKAHVAGEVRFDAGSRAVYAVDASNYRQVPIGVVIPRTVEDVVETIRIARSFGAPILSRGAGTSLAGQCCNIAVVIDWSKYLNEILQIDPGRKLARVLPGCVLDHLRSAAGRHGLTYGPDPATHSYCTLGGMLGNNACGVHAQMAGPVSNNVESLEVLTYDGTRMTAGWMTEPEMDAAIQRGGRVGEILSLTKTLRLRHEDAVRTGFPHIPRRISGYNLDQLLPGEDGRFNLGRALVGSEGTLVTILEATLNLVHNPPYQAMVVLGYPDIYQAGDDIVEIVALQPMGLEGIDYKLIERMSTKGMYTRYLRSLPEGKGLLLVQFPGESQEEADAKAQDLMSRMGRRSRPPNAKLYHDKNEEKGVWRLRETAVGAVTFVPGQPPAWSGWEDAAVPPARLGDYLRDFSRLMEQHGYDAALYGHFGQGCIHCRINFDLTSKEGIQVYRSFVEQAAVLVAGYGGSLSGEHGDGQSRGELLPLMFGNEIMEAFREFKRIWDPDWKMNPGKVIDANPLDSDLRLGADYHPWEPAARFKYPSDGGSFAHATLRCVGIGKCRRESSDSEDNQTMCPSFMATREEMHSTRGRAHLLWEMLQEGSPIQDGWRDENVKEALDLCLSCKGCKGDCPLNVDIATYKAEFLSHYWEGRIRPRHAYAFGFVDKWSRLASLWPGLVNLLTSTPGIRDVTKAVIGMAPQRSIPQIAPETFQSWFHKRPRRSGGSRVLLFPDTFNNYFLPRTARAAVEVLENAGYEVAVPRQHVCCGRPLYDHGLLDDAKEYLHHAMQVLEPYVDEGMPVIVLEPSCWSVLRDEIHGFFPESAQARKIMENTFLLSEFLMREGDFQAPILHRNALVHAHCHHKAIAPGADDERRLLERMQLQVEMLTDGCCGMAGAFGFEAEKYEVSVKVGEHVFLPAVRQAAAADLIVADGFSCREQIKQLTDRRALHTAEVLQLALQNGLRNSEESSEAGLVRQEARELRRSRAQTLGILGGIAVAGLALALLTRTDRSAG